jgi:hypothetical protein
MGTEGSKARRHYSGALSTETKILTPTAPLKPPKAATAKTTADSTAASTMAEQNLPMKTEKETKGGVAVTIGDPVPPVRAARRPGCCAPGHSSRACLRAVGRTRPRPPSAPLRPARRRSPSERRRGARRSPQPSPACARVRREEIEEQQRSAEARRLVNARRRPARPACAHRRRDRRRRFRTAPTARARRRR